MSDMDSSICMFAIIRDLPRTVKTEKRDLSRSRNIAIMAKMLPMSMTEFCRAAMSAELKNNPDLNVRRWAAAAGVSESGLRGFLNGYQGGITLDYIEKLAAARGKSPFDFLLPVGDAAFARWLSLLDDEDLRAVQRLVRKSTGEASLPQP